VLPGTGKSYVACALAQQACRKGLCAIYRRAPRLFEELALARADSTYPRALARFARFDVLVVDDFAMAPVTDVQRYDLLELLEDRMAPARRSSPANSTRATGTTTCAMEPILEQSLAQAVVGG
jgi:DNA replication protein DnaC